MSYIGSNKIGKMYLGTTEIGKAYLGSTLVYEAQHGPKIKTYTRTVTTKSGTTQYWVYFDLVLGAQYKIDFVSNGARNGGYIRVEVQRNGDSGNTWWDSGSWTFTYSTQASVERIGVYVSKPQAGTITLTITETIGA